MVFKMKGRSMVHGSIAHKQALKQSTFTKKSPLYDEGDPVPTEQTAPPTESTQQVAGDLAVGAMTGGGITSSNVLQNINPNWSKKELNAFIDQVSHNPKYNPEGLRGWRGTITKEWRELQSGKSDIRETAVDVSKEATAEGLSDYEGGAYPSEFDPNAPWAKSFGSNMAMAEELSRDYQASKSLKGDAKAKELNRMFGGTWKIGSFKDEEGNVHDNVWVNEMGQSPNMRRALAIPSAQRGGIRHGEDVAGYVSTDPRTGEASEEEIANIMKHNRAFEQIEDTIERLKE
jgi:hypothetical protein